ncbi:MAG: glycosyl hydrolase family 65 protein [Kiritimatiellia bacterium]
MAAAWMNVVYGFGGLRTDARELRFKPSLAGTWKRFSFTLRYLGNLLVVDIDLGLPGPSNQLTVKK